MSSNENNESSEMKAEQKPSENAELSEGEIAVTTEEPTLYKKVKLNSEQAHKKKHDHEKEDKGYDSDEKIKHKHKHKDNSSSGRDHRSDHHDHKEYKSKSEKSSEHKKKHKEHSRDDTEKKHKSKSEHRKSSEEKSSKKKSHKDKDREKSKEDRDKEKNKEKKNKKKEKKKEKEDAKQMKLDNMVEQNKEKKHKNKSKEDTERKFLDFAKKYPQFVHKGRFKFPIEDRLFILYSTLLAEHIPKTKKPTPKKGLIPPNCLGDILQIWNFFNSYSDLFKFEDIQREEIYAGLVEKKYDGDENLMLINDIHQGLLSLFTQEFIKKHRFETQKDEQENAFFILVKFLCGEETPDGDELSLIWTEFARRMCNLPWFKDVISDTGKKYLQLLGEKSVLGYNKLDFKVKTRILNELIECVHETEVFHEFLATKTEEMATLQRQKNDLLADIKAEEQEYYGLKYKLENIEKKGKDDLKGYMKDKKGKSEEAEKKELSKNQATLARLEASLAEKQAQLEEINSKLTFTTQTAQCIGLDANKSEYWVFMHEPNRIYIRHPAIMNDVETEDTWYYYDKKEDIDQLIKSLNPKGIREKNLLDNLKNLIKEGVIKFEEEDKEEEKTEDNKEEETKNEESMVIESEKKDEEKTKSTTSKKDKKDQKELLNDFNYWLAKVFEYETMVNNSDPSQTMRTTRRKFAQAQKSQPDRIRNKDPKLLNFERIKEMILKTEEGMTTYLERWEGHWAKPKAREAIIKRLKEAQTPQEVAQILVIMNEGFQWSKSPIGRRGRRKKEETEGQNAEGEGEGEEEEEGEDEEDEDEEESNKSDGENQYAEEATYGDDSPRIKKKKDRHLKILDESDENIEKQSDEERESDRSREEKEQREEREEKEEKEEKEEPQKEPEVQESGEKNTTEQPETEKKEGAEETKMDIQNEGEDEDDGRRYKRVALRIWGLSNEKARRCWINFTNKVDNLTSLYFSASMLCDFVDKYVAKKTAHYFTHYKTFKEYLAAKKQAKKEMMMKERALLESKSSGGMNVEKLDSYKMKKNAQRDARDREERRETRNAARRARNEGVSSRLRDKRADSEEEEEEEEEEAEYDYRPRADEKSRAKQEKLHELLRLRRSERLQRPTRKNLNEQQWNTECKTCGEEGELDDMVACSLCNSTFHLECVGLKKIPEGGYTCVDCLQKIASQRQTRSTTRKLHI